MTTIQHIRTTNKNVKDQRFRSRFLYANSMRNVRTFCGADPTWDDCSRHDGEHHLSVWRPMVGLAHAPSWLAEKDAAMCPACVAKLEEKKR